MLLQPVVVQDDLNLLEFSGLRLLAYRLRQLASTSLCVEAQGQMGHSTLRMVAVRHRNDLGAREEVQEHLQAQSIPGTMPGHGKGVYEGCRFTTASRARVHGEGKRQGKVEVVRMRYHEDEGWVVFSFYACVG